MGLMIPPLSSSITVVTTSMDVPTYRGPEPEAPKIVIVTSSLAPSSSLPALTITVSPVAQFDSSNLIRAGLTVTSPPASIRIST